MASTIQILRHQQNVSRIQADPRAVVLVKDAESVFPQGGILGYGNQEPAQDRPELSIDDEQLLQIMHDHVRALNESVVKTIEKVERTIDSLTSEERPANNGRVSKPS
ncbi:MAG: hypothetical protein GVY13_17205 [Alphaproteobacteria bacterium]|nr:hypothetical protein [Alphaproteobacteria bacterium]